MTTKVCTKCGEEKPLSEFHIAKRNSDGRFCYCRECRKINESNDHKTGRILIDDYSIVMFKSCAKCSILKPVSKFNKRYNGKCGLRSYCIECDLAESRAWGKKNPQKAKAKSDRSKFSRRDVIRANTRNAVDSISDEYVLNIISRNGLTYSEIKQHPELIELKREQLLAHRLYKTIKQKCYGKPNAS